MKRMSSWVLTAAIMLIGRMALTSAAAPAPATIPAVASTPIASSAPVTSIDQLTLRIEEGNGYVFMTDSEGIVQPQELQQVTNGEFPDEMSDPAKDFYTRTNVRDVYITFVNMVPPGPDMAADISAMGVEMRVAIFEDPESAATYVTDAIPELSMQAEASGTDPNLVPVQTMPVYDEAITGFNGMTPYFDVDTGEPRGDMPYTRFLAQVGSSIASASVSGEDTTLNEAIALELVLGQVVCIKADEPCAPMPIPVEFPNSSSAMTGGLAPSSADATTATVIVANANIPAMPSASGEIVAIAPSGQVLTITGDPVEAEGYMWLPVTMENGVSGWVAD